MVQGTGCSELAVLGEARQRGMAAVSERERAAFVAKVAEAVPTIPLESVRTILNAEWACLAERGRRPPTHAWACTSPRCEGAHELHIKFAAEFALREGVPSATIDLWVTLQRGKARAPDAVYEGVYAAESPRELWEQFADD